MEPHLKVWSKKYEGAERGRRLLACDGGGILGAMTLEMLAEIEHQLADMTGEGDDFRLGRFFDYIGGTSTGAILATGLAVGMTVKELTDFYVDSGPAMFQSQWLIKRARALYRADPLVAKLKSILGNRMLGDPDLECLLLIVARNATTDSPWPLTNNPFAKYNDPARLDNNHEIALWELVRASTAAPVYFPPEDIDLRDDLKFRFVDGGTTPYNNPSFLLYRMATIPEYRLGWESGEDKMMLVSVGTGSSAKVDPYLSDKGNLIVKNAAQLPGVFMGGSAVDQDINCRVFGRCVFGQRVDRELGDLIPRTGERPDKEIVTAEEDPDRIPLNKDLGRAFFYARHDPDVSVEGLEALGLENIYPEEVQAMDKVEFIPQMRKVGRAYAEKYIDMKPFERFV